MQGPETSPVPRGLAARAQPDLILTSPTPYRLDASGTDELRVFVVPRAQGGPVDLGRRFQARKPEGRAPHARGGGPLGQGPGEGREGPASRLQDLRRLRGHPQCGIVGDGRRGSSRLDSPKVVGRYLPPGSDVLIQVHYHKSGKPETDASSIGLYFARGAIDKQVVGSAVRLPWARLSLRPELRIPAGEANYEVRCSKLISQDVHLTAVVPHMHLLGKDFLMTAIRPDGTRRVLIRIDHWDFNWQNANDFVEPIPIPSGTRIEVLAHFDNSGANSRNPNAPPRDVRWGEQTTDEMCLGFLQLTRDDEHLNGGPPVVRPVPRDR